MKTDIHPKYFDSAEIRCSCGNIILAGSTKEKLHTELCSKCHPFYTGQQRLVDTAGRVDKFEAKRKKSAAMKEAVKRRAEEKKKKPEAYVEKVIPAEVIEKAMTGTPATQGKWATPIGNAPAVEVLKEEVAEAKKAEPMKKAKIPAPKKKPAAAKKTTTKKPAAAKKVLRLKP